jgi:hypothetical protein
LTVSGDIVVRRTRRLPIKGEVLVTAGTPVEPDQVVARANLPGILQTIKLAEKLGVEPKDVHESLKIRVGDPVKKGQLVAESKGIFGFFKQSIQSDFDGTIESISEVTGHALVREAPIPVDVTAYIKGKCVEVMAEEGAIIETRGAMVQGIFGVGGERRGVIRVAVGRADEVLDVGHIGPSDRGKFLVGGSGVTFAALNKAAEVGVTGIVVGGVRDSDLIQYLGFDIGVAITGSEPIPLTLVVTEGFGYLAMAQRTFDLLRTLEGREGSINGATQIRAGVIRPEVIVPLPDDAREANLAEQVFELTIGTPIRMIREPYFGRLGSVTELPAQLVTLESGTEVRVLRARLSDGQEVTVPRANVEIIASS